MATKYFKLPEIDPNAKFDGANDINELAIAVDHALQHVEEVGKDSHYVLPAATKTKLGGVIAGDNVEVESDGTISVNVNPYVLPPASYSTLGGVIVQKEGGLQLDTDGTLHVDNLVIGVPEGSVTTSKIKDGAITSTKIADNAVTVEKLGPSLKAQVEQMEEINSGYYSEVPFTANETEGITNLKVEIKRIAGIAIVKGSMTLVASGTDKHWKLGRISLGDTRSSAGLDEICGYAESVTSPTTVYPMALMVDNYEVELYLPKFETTAIPADTYNVEFSMIMFITDYR